MASHRRSKKGGRRRRRAARLPAAAAEAVLKRYENDRASAAGRGGRGGGESGHGTTPSSFVIRRGRLTPAARQLVRDMRRVMLPHCGERLRERRSSKLKDYLAAASLLGVTHLQLFTQTDAGLYFKLIQLPAGPTLSFRVLRFSLIHDIQRFYQQQKRKLHRAPDARDFLHPPLLILSPQVAAAAAERAAQASTAAAAVATANNIRGRSQSSITAAAHGNKQDKTQRIGKEEEKQQDNKVEALVSKVVKSAFPPIDIRTVELRDCRRVVLFRRENNIGSSSSTSSSSFSSSSTSLSSSNTARFQYQLRQYAVVRRIQDSTQIVTPGVRALVEAGSSRVAADRLLQQRFGMSLLRVKNDISVDNEGKGGEGGGPPFLLSSRGNKLLQKNHGHIKARQDTQISTATVVGKDLPSSEKEIERKKKKKHTKQLRENKQKKNNNNEEEDEEEEEDGGEEEEEEEEDEEDVEEEEEEEEEDDKEEEEDNNIEESNSGRQSISSLVVNKTKQQRRHGGWNDICEATLAREHAAAAADTDDEQCLSFDVSDVKTGNAIAAMHGKTTTKRRINKDGLLLMSVAVAAHQQEKKRKKGNVVTDAAVEDSIDAAADDMIIQEKNSSNSTQQMEQEEEEEEVIAAASAARNDGISENTIQSEIDVNQPKEEKLKMKVTLVELGPRMHLELIKIEEDICAGAVVFHNFVKKTSEELSALQRRDAELRQQREKQREEVQQALEREFQKCKKRKHTAEGSCDNSDDNVTADDQEVDTESCKEEDTETCEKVLEEDTTDTLQDKDDDVSTCATGAAAVDDQRTGNNRSKVAVKRKIETTVNVGSKNSCEKGSANSKIHCKKASAVLRRYEAATTRLHKDI